MSGEDKNSIEKERIEIEKLRIETEEQKINYMYELGKQAIEAFRNYYLQKTTRLVISSYTIVGITVVIAGILTYMGKISGETFSFLAGSIVGYIISVLAKHL